MTESIDALILKLSILNKGIENSKIDLLLHTYKLNSQKCIKEARQTVEKYNDNDFHSEYSIIACNVLSSSPFSSKIHLCQSLKCNKSTLDTWYRTKIEFMQKVDEGFINGEVLARDLMLMLSVAPASKVNTNLIKILANNVYSIEEQATQAPIEVNVNTKVDIEEELKKRGIPLPEIGIEDLNETQSF
jgi:hypothetical protein